MPALTNQEVMGNGHHHNPYGAPYQDDYNPLNYHRAGLAPLIGHHVALILS